MMEMQFFMIKIICHYGAQKQKERKNIGQGRAAIFSQENNYLFNRH